jgi:predicted metal-dependent enzyme (double-stranded beta helix superfamily)
MEQGYSQSFITAPPAISKFEPSLTSLQSNLKVWIRNAFDASDFASRLGLLCQQLEVATMLGLIELPDRFRVALPDRYSRRLIYEDSARGISVLAMVWAPGQSTLLHDHSGLWGVEAVLAGEIETVPFHLIGHENGHYHFHPRSAERVGVGATSYVIPPFEHHVTRNVSTQVAITLNIYGGEMPACNIFLPTESGVYTRQRRALTYSD